MIEEFRFDDDIDNLRKIDENTNFSLILIKIYYRSLTRFSKELIKITMNVS